MEPVFSKFKTLKLLRSVLLAFNRRNYSLNSLDMIKSPEIETLPDVGKRSIDEIDLNETNPNKKCKVIDGAENVKPIQSKREESKKKMALLLGYCGNGYYGMQKNPDVKTIELELFNAMLKANIIQPNHVEVPQEMGFQRAARTDKGVSAIRQVVSLKLPLFKEPLKTIKEINDNLPAQIKVFGIKRVTKGFDSKNSCDFRTYCYMAPSFAFAPQEIEKPNEEYRISETQLVKVNKFLSQFKGTHNFHNFTSGRKPDDDSCKRYLVQCECGEPFLRENLEFVKIKIKGQSFMLHQIRKIVGLTIGEIRGYTKPDTLTKAWAPAKVDVPIAPGLGLMLDFVHYENYDKKYGGNGFHEPLDWVEYQQEIEAFSKEQIFPIIVETEKNEKSMLTWMDQLILHSYDIREPCAPPNQQTEEKKEIKTETLTK